MRWMAARRSGVVLAALATLGVVSCGTTGYMQKGAWEGEGSFELSTSNQRGSDLDSDLLAFETFLGMAATDNLELGPAISYRDQNTGSGASKLDARDFLLAWRGRWNFPGEGPVAPFAEVDLGFGQREASTDAGKANSTAFSFGLGAGLRFIVSETAAVTLKGRYLNADWDREVGGDLDRWALVGGLSIRF